RSGPSGDADDWRQLDPRSDRLPENPERGLCHDPGSGCGGCHGTARAEHPSLRAARGRLRPKAARPGHRSSLQEHPTGATCVQRMPDVTSTEVFMAGHSKWANIKHRKAAQDAKRGKIFTKLIRELTVAAKLGGPEPADNPRLRSAVDKALTANMTRDTIDRA